ncbi:hypothetical protein MTBBW1_1720008 [Desulfamplus magnetovallimortis]|uniref:Uncharacterized protein n=1 Tax=Desulfamplus magnetovallimortis TaxID=1246637 RepID=A0A1W1H9P2_9BACT|nr:hypothetical protein [Desulfamplus magnetovallimortis]SLM29191.1 hypothetical protein MTBBW1_1720008 [Desulfamplus magnetovallimortis]
MIGQPSVMYNPGASSRCRESEWGGVCSKAFLNDREHIRIGIAPDFGAFPDKMSMEKPGSCRSLLTGCALDSTGNIVFLLANNVPLMGKTLICGG